MRLGTADYLRWAATLHPDGPRSNKEMGATLDRGQRLQGTEQRRRAESCSTDRGGKQSRIAGVAQGRDGANFDVRVAGRPCSHEP
jgi:hypothetical protein